MKFPTALFSIAMVGLAGVAYLAMHGTGIWGAGLQGDGKLTTETRQITDFSKIEAGGAFEVHWNSGSPNLSISTDENLLPHIKTVVAGDTLRIFSDTSITTSHGFKITVSSPSLQQAEISGAAHFTAEALSGQAFDLNGSGASVVKVSGHLEELQIDLSGAAQCDAAALHCTAVKATISGAAHANVFASSRLQTSISGAGRLGYAGHPPTVTTSLSGAGSVRPND